jgi:hypothetical protein
LSSLFSILFDILVNTLDKTVLKSLFNIPLSPWINLLLDNWTASSFLDGLKSRSFFFGPVDESLDVVAILRIVKDDLVK